MKIITVFFAVLIGIIINQAVLAQDSSPDFVSLFLNKEFDKIQEYTENKFYVGDIRKLPYNDIEVLNKAKSAIGDLLYIDKENFVSKVNTEFGKDIYVNNIKIDIKKNQGLQLSNYGDNDIRVVINSAGAIFILQPEMDRLLIVRKEKEKYKTSVFDFFAKDMQRMTNIFFSNSPYKAIWVADKKFQGVSFDAKYSQFYTQGNVENANLHLDNIKFIDDDRFIGSGCLPDRTLRGKRYYVTYLLYGKIDKYGYCTYRIERLCPGRSKMQVLDDKKIRIGDRILEIDLTTEKGYKITKNLNDPYYFVNDSIALFERGENEDDASTFLINLNTKEEVELQRNVMINYLDFYQVRNTLFCFTQGQIAYVNLSFGRLELENQLKGYLEKISKNNESDLYRTFFEIAYNSSIFPPSTLELWHKEFSRNLPYSVNELLITSITDKILALKDKKIATEYENYLKQKEEAIKESQQNSGLTFKEYRDGFYLGEMKDNMKHGRGFYVWKNFNDYNHSGSGSYFLIVNNTWKLRYEGNWDSDKPNGTGQMYFLRTDAGLIKATSTYVLSGILKDGLFEGLVTRSSVSSTVFDFSIGDIGSFGIGISPSDDKDYYIYDKGKERHSVKRKFELYSYNIYGEDISDDRGTLMYYFILNNEVVKSVGIILENQRENSNYKILRAGAKSYRLITDRDHEDFGYVFNEDFKKIGYAIKAGWNGIITEKAIEIIIQDWCDES